MRSTLCIALNVFMPGTGLVLAKRERWGTALALFFCVAGQVVIYGAWLTPASIPKAMTALAAAAMVVIWLTAQAKLYTRLSQLTSPDLESQIRDLIVLSKEAIEDGVYVNARLALESALTLDDEHVQVNVLWARLMTLMGRFPEARRTWKRVLELDKDGRYGREAESALQELPQTR